MKNRFKSHKQVHLIRGGVPYVLKTFPVNKVSLLIIDMTGYKSEIAVLKYFYSKMRSAGIIYFDDYGGRWPKLREVIDEFLADKPEELLTFDSPYAILIEI